MVTATVLRRGAISVSDYRCRGDRRMFDAKLARHRGKCHHWPADPARARGPKSRSRPDRLRLRL